MQNEKNIEYTYLHRQVVIYLATKYLKDEKTIAKIKNHDIDKMQQKYNQKRINNVSK